MPEFIELMITENKKEIRNVSMFITKAFEIRKKTLLCMPFTLSFLYKVYVFMCR